MGADQQFCLRWNNFHTNITSAFESLRDDEDFVDITLACEGRQIKAHKMVLSACSPYFRSLLRGNPCQHPIVFLKDVSFANLTSILDFMYHGEVNVSHNELATFLKTAEALRVRGLAEDEKKRDGDTCTESSSPPPPRDPPEPCSPGRPDDPSGEGGGGVRVSSAGDSGGGTTDTSSLPLSISEGPPTKRQRRRSGTNITTTITPSLDHDTTNADTDPLQQQQPQQQPQQQSETVGRESVKNEPEDYVNEDDDMLGQQQQQHQSQQHQQIANEDIKLDGFAGSNAADDQSEYLSGEGSISSRNQAAMQQLQDTFSTFIPGMTGQSPGSGFLQPPGSADHGRPHPPFSLEGVQGLPPGISALPGPSMSQAGGASQDASGQEFLGMTPSTSSNDLFQQVTNNSQQHSSRQQQQQSRHHQQHSSVSTSPQFLDSANNGVPPQLNLSSFDFQQLAQGFSSADLANVFQGTGGGGYSGGGVSSSARLTQHASRGGHMCGYCGKMLSSNHGLRRHIDDKHTVHVQTYTCTVCDKEYRTPNSLQNHMYVYHKRKDCGQTVAT